MLDDPPTTFLLAVGCEGGASLSPAWTRYAAAGSRLLPFWSRPQVRNGVEIGVTVALVGWSVIATEWFDAIHSTWSIAGWVARNGFVLIMVGALIALAVVRRLTLPLRLRRSRAACFNTGAVVAMPDLLGLVTGGAVIQGVAWDQVEGYRDDAELVALRRGGWSAPFLLPVRGEEQRVELLRLLDELGLPRLND